MRLALLGLLALLALVWLAPWRAGPAPPPEAELDLQQLLGDADSGFAQVVEPRVFEFPRDHGPHPDFGTEWWYFTGNLAAEERRFGYQVTFFRLRTGGSGRAQSRWSTDQVFMAHLALSDLTEEAFYPFERFSRAALGLAGAQTTPLRVWLEDWELTGGFPMHLRAVEDGVGVDLVLEQGKPPVLQGEDGLSRKGAEPGLASYYYSLTRMPTRGTVLVEGEAFPVEGLTWMDREWSSRSLADHLAGWDWFALQLDDGRELMFYQLRRKDGGMDPFSGGTLVSAEGTPTRLAANQVRLEVLDRWGEYPAGWRLSLPEQELELIVEPALADQEMDLSVRYWEGAVTVSGSASGRGYAELVGYSRETTTGDPDVRSPDARSWRARRDSNPQPSGP